ncbi:MAG TPA: folate-binding protein [Candidatus Tenderia sp.]|nr:folate-binding protein [Candidatus Tenderia sp.]
MNDKWHSFLNGIGAVIDNEMVTHFGSFNEEIKADSGSNIICDLSHIGLIKVQGEDASTFLHNQLTNDLKALAPNQTQLSGYCNPKGRLLALFRVIAQQDGYTLMLPREIIEPTLKRLRMFVMMSKVTLEDASHDQAHIGLSGPGIERALSTQRGIEPPAVDAAVSQDEFTLLRVPGPQPRYQLFGNIDTLSAQWQALSDVATPAGGGTWERLDIEAGLPVIHKETVESFVPQMVNLQAVGGLSFTKGCYPGQEVVARMQYLGKLKRRLYIACARSDYLPAPGDHIVTSSDNGERKTGEVVAAQWAAEKRIILTAVIEIATAESDSLHLGSLTGPSLTLKELPYPLEI